MRTLEELIKECECRAAANVGEERRFFLRLIYFLEDYTRATNLFESILEEVKGIYNDVDRR